VSDLGYLRCLSEGTKFDPNFGLCAEFPPSLLPMSDFGGVNNIRPPFDFDLSLQTLIWMIALSVPLCMWVEARNVTTYSISSKPTQPFVWCGQLFGLRAGNKVPIHIMRCE